jgi:hypothetical protein
MRRGGWPRSLAYHEIFEGNPFRIVFLEPGIDPMVRREPHNVAGRILVMEASRDRNDYPAG